MVYFRKLMVYWGQCGLNQSTPDRHICRVTLTGAKGLVSRRDASPAAQHDSLGIRQAVWTNVVWFDLVLIRRLIEAGIGTVKFPRNGVFSISKWRNARGWTIRSMADRNAATDGFS